jgi:hypothetical protein
VVVIKLSESEAWPGTLSALVISAGLARYLSRKLATSTLWGGRARAPSFCSSRLRYFIVCPGKVILLIWHSVYALTLRRDLVGWHSKLIVALALRPWAALLPAALRGGADERAPTVGQL